jgi:phage-related protein (TIGR01555 family)
MPEYVRIKKELRQVITSHGLGVRLLERCVQAIYGMKNLTALLATPNGESQLLQRLRTIDMSRSILNTMTVDSDHESYDFKNMTLTGVKEIIDSTLGMLSSVTSIPQTLLYGRSPAGENSTGESDMENWYNAVGRIQKSILKKPLKKVIDILLRAGINRGKIEDAPDYKLTFLPLWNMDELQEAQIEQAKAATSLTKAQTATMYVQMGALDPSEVRAGLAQDEDFTIETLLDEKDEDELWGYGGEQPPPPEQAGMVEQTAQAAAPDQTGGGLSGAP